MCSAASEIYLLLCRLWFYDLDQGSPNTAREEILSIMKK